jgi:hypothetical protein
MATDTDTAPRPLDILNQEEKLHEKSVSSTMEPCYFPILTDGIVLHGSSRQISVKVDTNVIRDFCIRNDTPLASFLQAAWILVLRSYTGADKPCFGCVPADQLAGINGTTNGHEGALEMLVCHADIWGTASVTELVKSVQIDVDYTSQNRKLVELGGRQLFNTTMSFETQAVRDTAAQSNISLEQTYAQDATKVSKKKLLSKNPHTNAW